MASAAEKCPPDNSVSTPPIAYMPLVSSLPKAPASLPAARKHPFARQWKKAYAEEVAKLGTFETFATVPRRSLPRNTIVPRAQVRLVYKEDDDGRLIGFRARIVYPGNRLISGLHYDARDTATFSADRDSLRIVIAIAAQKGYELYHVDLKSAFLHERFKGKTPLYLQPLPTFDGTTCDPAFVLMLSANLYGTPQACKVYVTGAYAHLRKHGDVQSQADHNVFTKETEHGKILIALTIDDFLVAASSRQMYDDLLATLSLKYRVNDLGKASRILNWTLQRPASHPGTFHLSQPHKTQQFIDLVGMSRANPARTPQAPGHLIHARQEDEEPLPSRYPYAAALGILRYVADCTRPDVAFITGSLARHTKDPALRHWQALQHVARYLRGTSTHGLHFRGTDDKLQAYADSDFANCVDNRQSTMATCCTTPEHPSHGAPASKLYVRCRIHFQQQNGGAYRLASLAASRNDRPQILAPHAVVQ